MKIHDLPTFVRPREKLSERGANALTDAELLAILLRTGYTGRSALVLAKKMLEGKSLKQLFALSINELSEIKGVGSSRASILAACSALTERIQTSHLPLSIKKPEDVARIAQFLAHKKKEHLLCLYLDARNQVLAQEIISVGTINSSILHPRELSAPAIAHRAVGVIIVHNHPSGDTNPSADDVSTTERLAEAGNLLDIPILDHIIVSRRGWASMKELELL